jgi:dethiobiotin synthetase
MKQPIFITGIGTGVGKTLVAAIVTEALKANYWKPIQAGLADGTDAQWVQAHISNMQTIIYPELYKLNLPASPHIAARQQGVVINIDEITACHKKINATNTPLVIEGAGGLLVPVNQTQFVADVIKALNAKVIIVSRNYLGSINHSLLTANVCRQYNLEVMGFIFNDQYMHYEQEIVAWSGYPLLGSIPFTATVTKQFVKQQAERLGELVVE